MKKDINELEIIKELSERNLIDFNDYFNLPFPISCLPLNIKLILLLSLKLDKDKN